MKKKVLVAIITLMIVIGSIMSVLAGPGIPGTQYPPVPHMYEICDIEIVVPSLCEDCCDEDYDDDEDEN